MLTIMIIFTLLVALWGHSHAFAAAREQRAGRRRHGSDPIPRPLSRRPRS